MLMTATLPVGPFNAAVRDGTVGAKLHRILEAIKPEAVYFTETVGIRSARCSSSTSPTPRKSPNSPNPGFCCSKPKSPSASQ